MAINLANVAKSRGIKYFLISFVDLFGVLRAKLVPARAIGEMQQTGAGFAGFAAWLDMTPAHPDMFGIPDPESLIQLPWKPEVGWLAGGPVDGRQTCRSIAARRVETPTRKGNGQRLLDEERCGMRILSHQPGRHGDLRSA